MSRRAPNGNAAGARPMRAQEFRAGTLSLMVSRSGGQLFADVFVDGQDWSLFSIRLDADENTATVYDAREDEGETIYPEEG